MNTHQGAYTQELLADPDAVTAMLSHLVTITSPKLLRYSLHNVAMLTKQAQERGMLLLPSSQPKDHPATANTQAA